MKWISNKNSLPNPGSFIHIIDIDDPYGKLFSLKFITVGEQDYEKYEKDEMIRGELGFVFKYTHWLEVPELPSTRK